MRDAGSEEEMELTKTSLTKEMLEMVPSACYTALSVLVCTTLLAGSRLEQWRKSWGRVSRIEEPRIMVPAGLLARIVAARYDVVFMCMRLPGKCMTRRKQSYDYGAPR
jgi:hypothetical protein